MCLAIALYVLTGIVTLLWQIILVIGIFTLTLIGKIILFICASIYTVANPRNRENIDITEEMPFITMYPELYNFEENFDTMARISLETVTSFDDIQSSSSRTSLGQSSLESFIEDTTSLENHNQHAEFENLKNIVNKKEKSQIRKKRKKIIFH